MSTIANTFLKILEFLQKQKWAILGLVVGIILGMIYAWYLTPVNLTNTTPGSLRSDFREDYLLWVARNYESQSLVDPEWARSQLLGSDYASDKRKKTIERDVEQMSKVLDDLASSCGSGTMPQCDANDATRLRNLSADVQTIVEPSSPNFFQTLWSILRPVCLVIFILLVVGGGLFILYRWWRGRQEEHEVRESIAERIRPVETVSWGGEGTPLAQFPTTYALGDDHFDPSFSIELDNGEFMGECGVGISETIGVGAPNKVTAFEVWLFDKSDIRTVTKVVMSDYAFSDEALRTKLAPKGEPMLAKEGAEIILETKTLRVKARIVEASYGMGNLPPNSFFEQLSIDLAAWVKPTPEGAEAFEEDISLLSEM